MAQIVNDIWKAEIAGYGKIMIAAASGKQIMGRIRQQRRIAERDICCTWQGFETSSILGPEIILVRGLVRLVPAVAYHFWLNLLATFSQPCTSIISGPSS